MILTRTKTTALYDVECINPELLFHIRSIQSYLTQRGIKYDVLNYYNLPFRGIITPQCVYFSPEPTKISSTEVSFVGYNAEGKQAYLTIPKDDYFHLKDLMS